MAYERALATAVLVGASAWASVQAMLGFQALCPWLSEAAMVKALPDVALLLDRAGLAQDRDRAALLDRALLTLLGAEANARKAVA